MSDITVCVATKEECDKQCKRRHLKINPYNQSYSNFSLDYMNEEGNCEAFIGFGKQFKNKKLNIN